MAAVELAWESQSMSRVGCSAAARQAAKFTAVVVFPTPPFWFATAMIRAKRFLASENLAKPVSRCKMFHVKHHLVVEIVPGDRELFHVERFLATANALPTKLSHANHASRSVPRGTAPCPFAGLLKRQIWFCPTN